MSGTKIYRICFNDLPDEKKIDHEDWTDQFLKEFKKNKSCKKYLDGDKLDNIKSLITSTKTETKIPIFFKNIISSQLDADRLDYLLRDSYYCGVSYGSYSADWMIHCLTIIDTEPSSIKNTKYKYRLGINKKGIGVTEQFLFARRLMKLYVYKHKKINSAEYLIETFLKELSDNYTTINKLFKIDKNLLEFLKETKEYKNKEDYTKNNFIKKTFKYYKEITDPTIYNLMKKISKSKISKQENIKNIKILCKQICERKLPINYETIKGKEQLAKKRIESFLKSKKIDKWKIKFLDPKVNVYKEKSKDKILIEKSSKSFTGLESESILINLVADKTEGNSHILVEIETNKKRSVKSFIKSLWDDKIITDKYR